MKALKIFDDISKDMRKKDLSRRDALREGLNFGLKSALMALPLALIELKSNKSIRAKRLRRHRRIELRPHTRIP